MTYPLQRWKKLFWIAICEKKEGRVLQPALGGLNQLVI